MRRKNKKIFDVALKQLERILVDSKRYVSYEDNKDIKYVNRYLTVFGYPCVAFGVDRNYGVGARILFGKYSCRINISVDDNFSDSYEFNLNKEYFQKFVDFFDKYVDIEYESELMNLIRQK